MQTTFSVKAQIFIRTTVYILIVCGKVNTMNKLECFKQSVKLFTASYLERLISCFSNEET